MEPRILVVDGYTKHAREELIAGGATIAAEQYVNMLTTINSKIQCDILFPFLCHILWFFCELFWACRVHYLGLSV